MLLRKFFKRRRFKREAQKFAEMIIPNYWYQLLEDNVLFYKKLNEENTYVSIEDRLLEYKKNYEQSLLQSKLPIDYILNEVITHDKIIKPSRLHRTFFGKHQVERVVKRSDEYVNLREKRNNILIQKELKNHDIKIQDQKRKEVIVIKDENMIKMKKIKSKFLKKVTKDKLDQKLGNILRANTPG